MRTSSPRRWIWIRIPSSFHSTDERSKPSTASPTLAAVEASIGKIGRKSSNPTSRSPSSPRVSASSAVCREITRQHQRPARQRARHGRRLRDRVDHEPGERTLPELAGEEALDEVRLGLGRAARAGRRAARSRAARRAGPGHALNGGDRAIEVFDRERRLLRGRLLDPVDRRGSRRPRGPGAEHRSGSRRPAPPRRDRAAAAAPPGSRSSAERELVAVDVPRYGHDVGEQGHLG